MFSCFQLGDKLIVVNGRNVDAVDHYEAVGIMKEAGSVLRLIIKREVPVNSPQQVSYRKITLFHDRM